MSLKREFSVSFAARILQAAIHIGTTAVIARLLTPHELGVFAIAMGVVMVMESLRVFGIFAYLVRAPRLDAGLVRAGLGLSLLLSLALAAAIGAGAEPLARFYADDGVALCLKILAANMLIAPWPGLVQALLQRARRYPALAAVQTAGLLAGNAASILLVLAGWSYAALAIGMLVQSLVILLIGLAARPEGFLWRPAFAGVKPLLAFGAQLTFAQLVQQLGARAGELVLGRVQTLGIAAFYDKAGALARMVGMYVSPALAQVLLPAFSAELAAGARVEDVYLARLRAVTALIWPLLAFLALFAHPLIAILYGGQWLAAAPAASLLALAGMAFLPFAVAQTLLVAAGRPGGVSAIQTVYQGLRILLVLLLAPFGLVAVALGEVLASLVYALVSQTVVVRVTGLRPRAILRALLPSLGTLAAAASAAGAVMLAIGYAPAIHPLAALVLGAAATGAGALTGLAMTGHPLWREIRRRLKASRGSSVRGPDEA
ncbi:MAG: sugar transporter [Rhodothalassiaceae bacterium]|nr:MAG: sugar transporter [Rhodothalassiaceae bacterium]